MMKKQVMFIPALAIAGLLFGACSMNNTTADQPTDQGQPPNDVAGQNGPGSQRSPQGSGRPNPSGMRQLNYASASAKLGVSEATLKAALEGTDGKRTSLTEAAKTLNVTEAALRTALGIPEGRGKGQPNGQPAGSPPAESK